jgi:hypothetical protein
MAKITTKNTSQVHTHSFSVSPPPSTTAMCISITWPKPSGWKCYLFGLGEHGMIVEAAEGQVPNFIQRFFQRILLGNKWVKNKKIIDHIREEV